MKKYNLIFLGVLLSMKTHAMDKDPTNETRVCQCTLLTDYGIILDQLNETSKHLIEISESCIKRLVECAHKLGYIKDFESVDDIGQYVTCLDKYIGTQKDYIHSLRHPTPEMGSTAHDAAKLIPLLENMIKNAEEKKELAIAKTPKTTIKRLEIAHKEIILKLESLLLPNSSLHKNLVEDFALYRLDNLNSKIQSAIEYIHRHLESDSWIYHLLDIRPRDDYFDNTKILLSEVIAFLSAFSKKIQTVSGVTHKTYNPLNVSCGKLPPPNVSKRDS